MPPRFLIGHAYILKCHDGLVQTEVELPTSAGTYQLRSCCTPVAAQAIR